MLLDNYIAVPPADAGLPAGSAIFLCVPPPSTPLTIIEGGNLIVASSFINSGCSTPTPTVLNIDGDDGGAPHAAQFAYATLVDAGGAPTTAWGATPPVSSRTVVNVATSSFGCTSSSSPSCGADISSYLESPASWGGGPLALYFPQGSYYLTTPITVPAGLDVTILGDGWTSNLYWEGSADGGSDPYMIHFRAAAGAPAIGSVRDLQLQTVMGYTLAGGVRIDTLDNPGDMVFIDQGETDLATSGIDILGLDDTLVRADMSHPCGERGFGVTGGGAGAESSASTQGLVLFGGGVGPSSNYAEIKNWGKAVVIGSDTEGFPAGLTLSQPGYFTLDGWRDVPTSGAPGYASQPNTLVESTFRGKLTLMATNLGMQQIISESNPHAMVLSLSNFISSPSDTQLNDAGVANGTQLEYYDQYWDHGAVVYASTGLGSGNAAFIKTMLADVRNTYEAPPYRACGLTNVRIHRVFFACVGGCSAPNALAGAAFRVQHP
jgi:hypothetical protein